jgi:hypothetical protein
MCFFVIAPEPNSVSLSVSLLCKGLQHARFAFSELNSGTLVSCCCLAAVNLALQIAILVVRLTGFDIPRTYLARAGGHGTLTRVQRLTSVCVWGGGTRQM